MRGSQTVQVKMPGRFVILNKIQQFFLNKGSLVYCKPLVNFQNLEKLTLKIFASIFVAFMEEWILFIF